METIILGVDPGTLVMGYGLIAVKQKKARLLVMGVLKLSRHKDGYERLRLIYEKVAQLIREYEPSAFAVEAPFFGKNVQSMLKLGRAQGVAIAAAMNAGLPVTEYAPKTVKQVITGNGNADKEQVWKMLRHILDFEERPEYLDATDGLAVALCHLYQSTSISGTTGKIGAKGGPKGKKSSWASFVTDNPDRVSD
jgi:crossover junction endodeoxyribonuclease RuvC